MPKVTQNELWNRIKLVSTLVVLLSLVGLLLYYLYMRFWPSYEKNLQFDMAGQRKGDNGYLHTTIDFREGKSVLSHKLQLDLTLPRYVSRTRSEVDKGYDLDFDLSERFGVDVVSTGKLSTSEIKDPDSQAVLAKVLLLEVQLDDPNESDLGGQFDIVLKVFTESGNGDDIASIAYNNPITITEETDGKTISGDQELDNKDYEVDVVKPGDKLPEYMSPEEFIRRGMEIPDEQASPQQGDIYISQSFQELFSNSRKLRIFPYLKNEVIEYELGILKKDSQQSYINNYALFMEKYYGGEDSKFIELVVSENMSKLKRPVFVTEISFTEEQDEQ